MAKNRIKVSILGSDYMISSEEDESYMLKIAAETEKRVSILLNDNPRLSVTMASMLAALDYCDEAIKASQSADHLRSQIKDYLEDSSKARMEADEARREIEKLRREVQTLRGRLESDAQEGRKSQPVPGRTVAAPAPISRPSNKSRIYSPADGDYQTKSDQKVMDYFQTHEAED